MKFKIFLFLIVLLVIIYNVSYTSSIERFLVNFSFRNNFRKDKITVFYKDSIVFNKILTTNESTSRAYEVKCNIYRTYESVINGTIEEKSNWLEEKNEIESKIVEYGNYVYLGDTLKFEINNKFHYFVVKDSTKIYYVDCTFINDTTKELRFQKR